MQIRACLYVCVRMCVCMLCVCACVSVWRDCTCVGRRKKWAADGKPRPDGTARCVQSYWPNRWAMGAGMAPYSISMSPGASHAHEPEQRTERKGGLTPFWRREWLAFRPPGPRVRRLHLAQGSENKSNAEQSKAREIPGRLPVRSCLEHALLSLPVHFGGNVALSPPPPLQSAARPRPSLDLARARCSISCSAS